MISPLGTKVVAEIAHRCDVGEDIVMRAFLTSGLMHQQELMKIIEQLRGTDERPIEYAILDGQIIESDTVEA